MFYISPNPHSQFVIASYAILTEPEIKIAKISTSDKIYNNIVIQVQGTDYLSNENQKY